VGYVVHIAIMHFVLAWQEARLAVYVCVVHVCVCVCVFFFCWCLRARVLQKNALAFV
jgi:hypothetical protein